MGYWSDAKEYVVKRDNLWKSTVYPKKTNNKKIPIQPTNGCIKQSKMNTLELLKET